ncbi:MAG: LPS export ABC transporter periplasmic protein LptC, partial [Nitrospina sp.]|nr:LPS export ABC transporter periplasmic protein LptC [Nitrospina sp.]
DKSGRKDWELKAELAKINQNKKTTAMDKVEIIFFKDEMKKIKVYADSGTLMNKTNDLSLEGNVKMLIQEDILKKHTSNAPVAKNSKLSIR